MLDARGIDLEAVYNDTGIYALGRAVTNVLRVSPNGNNSDGFSWRTAYRTIQAALDAASTNGNDCTLIEISPHETNYNINRAGDPTWNANVILHGTHRNWAKVKNSHPNALSIMKLTGKSSVINLNLNLGRLTNGLIMTHGGCRVYRCQFVGEDLTVARTALHLDHASGGKHAKVIDCAFVGEGTTHMTGILVDQFGYSNFEKLQMRDCLTAIKIVGANSNRNLFDNIDIGDSGIGFDIDAGNEQHLNDVTFHNVTTNIDDEVEDHLYANLFGQFNVTIEPLDLNGVTVNTGAAGVWGGDTEIRAAVTSTKPFRIVGIYIEPLTAEWYQMRFSVDSGATFYDIIQFNAEKESGVVAPSGTEFIFNVGTRISASVRDESGADSAQVWLRIQEI